MPFLLGWIWLLSVLTMNALAEQPLAPMEHRLRVEFRTDLEINNSDEARDRNKDTQGRKFSIARAFVGFSGKLGQKTSYTTLIRVNGSFDREASQNPNTQSPGLWLWYVDRQLLENLTVRLGRQQVAIGAFENHYAEIDQYVYSYLSSTLPSYTAVGAGITSTYFGQEITLQLLNSAFEQDNQGLNSMNLNARWISSFWDGLLKSIVSYGRFPSSKQVDTEGDVTREGFSTVVITAGFQLNLLKKKLSLDLESGTSNTPSYIQVLEGGEDIVPQEALNNIVFQARYRFTRWHPLFKLSTDNVKSGGDRITRATSSHTRIAGGTEYYPDTASNTLRLHALFISQTERPDEGRNVTHAQINLGAAFKF